MAMNLAAVTAAHDRLNILIDDLTDEQARAV